MSDNSAKTIAERWWLSARVASRFARDFANPEALKKYLTEHPGADPKNHKVVEDKGQAGGDKVEHSKLPADGNPPEGGGHGPSKGEAPAKKSKGLFSPEEMTSLPDAHQQPDKEPEALFAHAKEAHEQQLDWLNRGKGLDSKIGGTVIRADQGDKIDFEKPGPIILIGPMKRKERAGEKVDADYGGDWTKLGDIVRASVAVDSMDQLDDVVAKLKASGLKLARKPKDRFAKPTAGGYRDVIMNVIHPNGHVGEIQLHLKPILKAKKDGHKFYEDVRTIEAKAKTEGRDTMTPEEETVVNDANAKMKALYDEAWNKATGQKVSSMKTALREAPKGAKLYDFDGKPAYWEKGKFPKVVGKSGEKVVYELQNFFQEAAEVSPEEWAKL